MQEAVGGLGSIVKGAALSRRSSFLFQTQLLHPVYDLQEIVFVDFPRFPGAPE